MRIRIGMLVIMLELGFLSCSPVALAQYPAQRFSKVTASQVETTTLTLRHGSGVNKVMTSDAAGNAMWQNPTEPQDVGWHPTDDGNSITSLYRKLVLGGPTAGNERLLVQGYSGWSYGTDLIEPSYAFKDDTYCFASSSKASACFDNELSYVWKPTDNAPWVALRFIDGKHQLNRVTLYKYKDDDGQGVIRFPWDEFVVYGSNSSTNGSDGDWTPISPRFTVQHVSEKFHSYDFPENQQSYEWLKLAGVRSGQPAKLWLHEVEAFTYLPTPARKFLVDATGNPATDGTMTAAAFRFTPLAAAPESPTSGTAYFDAPSRKLRVWDGTAWQNAW